MRFLCAASFVIAFIHRCIGAGEVCGGELNGTGFTDYNDLVHLNQTEIKFLPDRNTATNGIQFWSWLFPNTLIFSCGGLLGGWIVRAEPRNISTISNVPRLVVFYFDGESSNSMVNRYILRSNSDQVPIITSTSSEGVYQYTLQQPVQVEVGDVVGVQYQVFPAGDNFLQLAFLNNTNLLINSSQLSYRYQTGADRLYMIPRNSSTQEVGLNIVTGYLPVVTPIMYSPSTSTEAFTPTSSIPTTVEGPAGSSTTAALSSIIMSTLISTAVVSSVSVEEISTGAHPTDSLTIVIGVGVAAGFVVALILAAIVVVVMLLVYKRRKGTQVDVIAANEFSEPLDNPTYNRGLEKDLRKKSAGAYELPIVESNLDAAPRRNGLLHGSYTAVLSDEPPKPESNGTAAVRNYEVVPEISQSGDFGSSVVYQEVPLKVKGTSANGEYYNVAGTSAKPQDYSLPSDCLKPQDYAVPEDSRNKPHPQDYAVPESSSPSGRPQEHASPQGALDQLQQHISTEISRRPQDYSIPFDSRQSKSAMPGGLTDSQNYSLPEPEDYSTPVPSERTKDKSEPYEVPTVSKSKHHSNRQLSGFVEDDDEGSSSLDVGLYVPSEREREMYGIHRPDSSSTAAPSSPSSRVDEAVYSRIAELQQQTSGAQKGDPFFVEDDIYWVPASSKTALYDQLAKKKYREILRNCIRIIRYLGSGQFGTVNLGCWKRSEGSLEVAVKMLKPHSTEEGKVKFLQEAAIMGQFLHPHVVKLHGVVTVGEPIMIVLEYMEKGDLKNYLRVKESQKCGSDPGLPHLLLNFCREIALGMAYLSSKSFVHRDLAARNILLSTQETCKIGDFGMSRDLEDNNYYITHGGQIPVRWTAPEALHFRKYSTASDVWSYGMVMYEIWSLGRTPYDNYSNNQILELLSKGFRLPPPPGCSRALYELIMRCWHEESSRRPLFSAIVTMLSHDDAQLLHWSKEDIAQSSLEARSLGASKNCADNLYRDVQNSYKILNRSKHM